MLFLACLSNTCTAIDGLSKKIEGMKQMLCHTLADMIAKPNKTFPIAIPLGGYFAEVCLSTNLTTSMVSMPADFSAFHYTKKRL